MDIDQLRIYIEQTLDEERKRSVVTTEGKTLTEALIVASRELGVPIHQLDYEIDQSPKFRPFARKKIDRYRIRAYKSKTKFETKDNIKYKKIITDTLNVSEEETKEVGKYRIRFRSSGDIELKVDPYALSARPPSPESIVSDVKKRGGDNIDLKVVNTLLKENKGEWKKIGDYRRNSKNDAKIELIISKDKLRAEIMVEEPKARGADASANTIFRLLEKERITAVLEDRVYNFEKKPQYQIRYLVARGEAPINGKDQNLSYQFSSNVFVDEIPLTDKGLIDFKNFDILKEVTEGDILAVVTPPTQGSSGKDIYGYTLSPVNGKEVEIEVGKDVALSDDKSVVTAGIAGLPRLTDGLLTVDSAPIRIERSVGEATGGVLEEQSVIIEGDVEDGYTVISDGNVEVTGSVYGNASIFAKGVVIIHGGIKGHKTGTKSIIEAGGSLWTLALKHCHLMVGGNLIVSGPIIMSTLEVNGSVIGLGNKSSLVGGEAFIGENLSVASLGTAYGMHTYIELAYKRAITKRILEEYNSSEIDKEKINELTRELRNTAYDSLVSVSGNLYTGVVLNIQGEFPPLLESMKRVSFERRNGRVMQIPYRSLLDI